MGRIDDVDDADGAAHRFAELDERIVESLGSLLGRITANLSAHAILRALGDEPIRTGSEPGSHGPHAGTFVVVKLDAGILFGAGARHIAIHQRGDNVCGGEDEVGTDQETGAVSRRLLVTAGCPDECGGPGGADQMR